MFLLTTLLLTLLLQIYVLYGWQWCCEKRCSASPRPPCTTYRPCSYTEELERVLDETLE